MLSDDMFWSIGRFTCRAPDGQDLRVLQTNLYYLLSVSMGERMTAVAGKM